MSWVLTIVVLSVLAAKRIAALHREGQASAHFSQCAMKYGFNAHISIKSI